MLKEAVVLLIHVSASAGAPFWANRRRGARVYSLHNFASLKKRRALRLHIAVIDGFDPKMVVQTHDHKRASFAC